MANDQDSAPAKKHKVIHWNPGTGDQQPKKRWTPWRVLKWTVGGFVCLLFAAGIVIRVAKLVFGPEVVQMALGGARSTTAGGASDPGAIFVNQSKAEFAHETATKALQELRRIPLNHPVQLQQLILIEKDFNVAEAVLASGEYGRAVAQFDVLDRRIELFARDIKMKQEVQTAYDNFLVKKNKLEAMARSLAPDAWEAAVSAAGAGRQFMTEGSFSAAKAKMDEATANLGKAEKALADFVEDSLQRGQAALTKGQKETATAAFTAALEKSAGNEVAVRGLKRAETIDRVYSFLVQGEEHEKAKRYTEAAEVYGRAFVLDPLSATAQQGKSRAERRGRRPRGGPPRRGEHRPGQGL